MTKNNQQDIYYRVGKSPFIYAGYNCNNRCIFCFEADRKFSHKTTNQLKREIKIVRNKFNFINFMGQEPTLRKDIIKLVGYAKNLDFDEVGITTNGRMFAYPDFTKNILKSGLSQIVLTVAGSTPQMHDGHTLTKGSFKQALTGIKNILSSETHHLSFIINIMVTQRNFRKLLSMVDFYADLGIREMNIGHVMPLNKKIVHSKKIIAPMGKVTPFLIKCHDKYKDKIKFLFVEYPACVFPEKYRHLAFPCLEENPQKVRIELCRKCHYKSSCVGISKAYLNLYGSQEFKL
jgi:MoaA/NifB/PqqE/SkfB family radical SAM enzyme